MTRRTNSNTVAATVEPEFWRKDGRWHIAEEIVPTEADRKACPVSYPEGDPGPFYRWVDESFATREEALDALDGRIS